MARITLERALLKAKLVGQFNRAMSSLGPFEPKPFLAAGVSGGPDSLALALLANEWVRARGGKLLALVVDHALRPESYFEACDTVGQLFRFDIPAQIVQIRVGRTTALSEYARIRRFEAMTKECAHRGILHLLLGHHVADQAETVIIRTLAGSGPAGMAGMAALVEGKELRLVRPLLDWAPCELRKFLVHEEVPWVEDPSNRNPAAQRARIRMLRYDAAGSGPATRALAEATVQAGIARGSAENEAAHWLAAYATIHPGGYVLLPSGPFHAAAFGALIRMVGGHPHAPASTALAALAAKPSAATLGGTRLLPGQKLGAAWVLSREASAMAGPVPARPGATWDGRFRLAAHAAPPKGSFLGPVGAASATLRRASGLPAALLATLPAIWRDKTLFAVPHIGYPDAQHCMRAPIWLDPPLAAAGARFIVPRAENSGPTGVR